MNDQKTNSGTVDLFVACATAIEAKTLIRRQSANDKEFHFQDWVGARLKDADLSHTVPGRNTYPDFKVEHFKEGYEVKGLETPGRFDSFDSNSRVPAGEHDGYAVYYVFGRYPKKKTSDTYPVLDLVMCHGDFLNTDRSYVHENLSFRGNGAFGDVLIRDRKMYVLPTPYKLASNLINQVTLIVPADVVVDDRVQQVGNLQRIETELIVSSYRFDLTTNTLTTESRPNPTAGRLHTFRAYRMRNNGAGEVELMTPKVGNGRSKNAAANQMVLGESS